MKKGTYLEIDLGKIEENSRRIVEKCLKTGITVLGVTKGFSAAPRIVAAMIRGGVTELADSRLENISSLRTKGFDQKMTLLRIPRLSTVKNVVRFADYSVNSEYEVIKALSDAAAAGGRKHGVVLMVDVGDLREGVLPERRTALLKGIRIVGVGTNMGCFGGILPTLHNLNLLLEIGREIEEKAGIEIAVLSGGGTSSLRLVESGEIPAGINQLRIGEGLLLGTDTTHNYVIPWLHQDAFLLRAEIIELKVKPSVPVGMPGLNAFGRASVFEDRGLRNRAIVSLGRQDVNVEGLIPLDPNMHVLGASSDHLIVDVTDAAEEVYVGGQITFRLNYQGLLFLCNSKYVKKYYHY